MSGILSIDILACDGLFFFGQDRADQPVPTTRKSFYVSRSPSLGSKRTSDHRNVLCQIGFVHYTIRPDCCEHLFFGHNLPGIFYQHQQCLDCFSGHCDRPVILQKDFCRGIQRKRSEFI